MAKATKATKATKAIEPEVLPADDQDVKLVTTDGGVIAGFLRDVTRFFREANALEAKAKSTLLAARALVAPKTQEQDVAIQTFIKTATADTKALEAHWSICQTFSQVHRRLTAARARGTEPLETAKAIAQKFHNDYAEAERRRAAEEQERERLAAEARARADREAELARLEAEAVKRESESADLSDRETWFVDLIVSGNSPVASAKTVGYKNPEQQGPRLMELVKIVAAIKARQDAIAIRQQATAKRDAPLDVRVETVRPAIGKPIGGGHDRTSHSGEVLNERLFVEAAMGGQHGIPLDCLMVNPVKLNDYARSLQERINLWPGIRYKKTTTTV